VGEGSCDQAAAPSGSAMVMPATTQAADEAPASFAGASLCTEDQWLCESVRGSVSLLRLPALARPRLIM
jgi:hypothetical protein